MKMEKGESRDRTFKFTPELAHVLLGKNLKLENDATL